MAELAVNRKVSKNHYALNGRSLTLDKLFEISTGSAKDSHISIDPNALKKMTLSREYVYKIVEKGEPVYGINTGFGALATTMIKKEDLTTLQYNIIRSHCTGVGPEFDRETTRAIMLLRANCLCTGNSGVNPDIVKLLCEFLNNDVLPCIPSQGSVGASGDLAPLSHVALTLIGEGEVIYKNQRIGALKALELIGEKPAKLGPKDGLALINGTAVMCALGGLATVKAKNLAKHADIISALSVEALRGSKKAYFSGISELKPHPGQLDVVKNMNALLKTSEISKSHVDCDKVQDPYSLRCIPQVHGAIRQTIKHAEEVFNIEINAVTDNPLIFPEKDMVVSGGNFHGEALALSMDYLAMGLSELCSISERRIEKMMNPQFSELPHFLTQNSGLNSGLMIAHVTVAALTSENKVLSHPASVDSIPTSTDKEDHVSMGVTSGRKLQQILENLNSCLAIELLANTQGIDLLRPLKSNKVLENVYSLVRTVVEPIKEDRVFAIDINKLKYMINSNEIVKTVNKSVKGLL